MNCTTARQQMALRVGNDLSQSGVFQVERHLLTCPQCRELYEQLVDSSEILVAANTTVPKEPRTSLLPLIEAQLPELAPLDVAFRFSRFLDGALRVSVVAVAAMVVATLLPDFVAQHSVQQPVSRRVNLGPQPASIVRYYPDSSWQTLEHLEPVEDGGEALRNVSY